MYQTAEIIALEDLYAVLSPIKTAVNSMETINHQICIYAIVICCIMHWNSNADGKSSPSYVWQNRAFAPFSHAPYISRECDTQRVPHVMLCCTSARPHEWTTTRSVNEYGFISFQVYFCLSAAHRRASPSIEYKTTGCFWRAEWMFVG